MDQFAHSLPSNSASYYSEIMRELLRKVSPGIKEVIQPDTHSFMRRAGILLTRKDGVFLEERRNHLPQRPFYEPKNPWKWA